MAKEQDTNVAEQDSQAQQETVTTPEGQPQQQLRIDEAAVSTYFSSTSRIWGTAEEIIIDFSQGVRPSGQKNISVLKIDARIVMSPWAAKRLAIALGQTVQRYEQTYGILEIDPRKRMQAGAAGRTTTAT